MTIYAHHQLPIKDVSESEGQGQGKGLGKTLYNKLLPNLAEFGIRRLYAVIALPNNISMGYTNNRVLNKWPYLMKWEANLKKWSVAMLEKRL